MWRSVTLTCRQPSERREHHEEIGRAFALVFVIEPRWPPLFIWTGARVSAINCFEVSSRQTSRHIGIARPRVHGQYVFHGHHDAHVGLADDPLLFNAA